jgi:GDP-L-fucose synthase
MNILVTGANGFIGSNIIKSLSNNTRFKFFNGNRNTINLYSIDNIKQYLKENKIDTIIHCAIEGGSRLKKDDANNFYNNILIFENLYSCRNLINKFINTASGAEFDRNLDINLKKEEEIFQNVPRDYYGLSKNIISQKTAKTGRFYNLRIFACFDENELDTRFIKSSIIKSLKSESIIIHEDKVMDFFYLKDLITVVEHALLFDLSHKDINLSYKTKYKLSEIARKIIKQNNSKSEIIIQNKNGLNYNGDFNKLYTLPIHLQGFETGLQNTIINIKTRFQE